MQPPVAVAVKVSASDERRTLKFDVRESLEQFVKELHETIHVYVQASIHIGWIGFFIAAIPALARDTVADELATRLTVIEEGQSRFFTSPEFDICWADILRNERIADEHYAVGGRIYCITPINEVNGSATLSVSDIVFAGPVDWGAS